MAVPSDIAKCDAWYDATHAASLTLADTDRVAAWSNRITGDHPILLKLNDIRRPQTGHAIGPNSLNSLYFTTDDQLEVVSSQIARTQPLEIWIALLVPDTTLASNQYIIDGDTTRPEIYLDTSGNIVMAAPTDRTGSAFPTDGQPHVLRCLFSGADSVIELDNSSTLLSGVSPGTDGLEHLVVGANKAFGNPMTGYIGEVMVFDDELTAEEQNSMWSHGSRWTTSASPPTSNRASTAISLSL